MGSAIAGGVSSIIGGLVSGAGSYLGSQQQQKGLSSAIQTQVAELTNLAKLMEPYFGTGQQYNKELQNQMSTLTKRFNPTMADLESTPGYQFTLNQGLQAVANAYSGMGLGNGVTQGATASTPSGPGVKGALNYAQGLAASTYQQQFQNYLAQNSQIYNMLMGGSQLGEQASAAWGGVAQQGSNQISGYQSASGAASALGTQGLFNALGQSISAAGNAYSNYGFFMGNNQGTANSLSGSSSDSNLNSTTSSGSNG